MVNGVNSSKVRLAIDWRCFFVAALLLNLPNARYSTSGIPYAALRPEGFSFYPQLDGAVDQTTHISLIGAQTIVNPALRCWPSGVA